MARLRVGTWNIAGARREPTNQVDLDAVVAGIQALGVELLAVQEVDRQLARSGRSDQPTVIAQALGAGWFWSSAPALVGDDFRPLAGPDPGGPAYGNLLVSRLPLAAVEQLRFPRPAAVSSAPRSWPASRWACARSRWRPLICPTAKATTSASCGSCSSWSGPGRLRGCWWAT
jgi:endonuclease/exonuclease/phosphatase family metal-dependent hydrolase